MLNLSKLKFFFLNNFVFLLNMILFLFIILSSIYSTISDISFAAEVVAKEVDYDLGREFLENIARLEGVDPDDPAFRARRIIAMAEMHENFKNMHIDPNRVITQEEIDLTIQTYEMARADSFWVEQERKAGRLVDNADFVSAHPSITNIVVFFYSLWLYYYW